MQNIGAKLKKKWLVENLPLKSIIEPEYSFYLKKLKRQGKRSGSDTKQLYLTLTMIWLLKDK